MGEHPLHIVDESHPQHFIGLIEHQGPQARQVEGALTHVVHDPPRGADHDLDAPFELVDLLAEIGAAVDRQNPHMVEMGGIAAEGIGHLQRQLAGGSQDQHLGFALLRVEGRQHR